MLMNENTKIKLGYLGTVEGKSMYNIALNDPDMVIDMFKKMKPNENKYCETNREYFKVKRQNEFYYVFGRTDGVDVFIEMPLVSDTELFIWTRKYRQYGGDILWTQLTKGELRFNCTYSLLCKSTSISVMFNKANVGNISINNGDNEDIMNRIEEFCAEFEGEVCFSTSCADIKNTNRFA